MLGFGRDRSGYEDLGIGLLYLVRDVVVIAVYSPGEDPGFTRYMPSHDSIPDNAGMFCLGHGSDNLLDNLGEVAKHFIVRVIGIRLHGLL